MMLISQRPDDVCRPRDSSGARFFKAAIEANARARELGIRPSRVIDDERLPGGSKVHLRGLRIVVWINKIFGDAAVGNRALLRRMEFGMLVWEEGFVCVMVGSGFYEGLL